MVNCNVCTAYRSPLPVDLSFPLVTHLTKSPCRDSRGLILTRGGVQLMFLYNLNCFLATYGNMLVELLAIVIMQFT